jgi:hypothetical protein
VAQHDGLIALLIERNSEVSATLTGGKIGKMLSVPKSKPALPFQRWYFGNNSALIQITISVRPAGRFTYLQPNTTIYALCRVLVG